MTKVYTAIFTNQDREFVWSGKQLPLFDSLFGIYEELWDAVSAVSHFLYSEHKEFVVLEDCPCSDGNGHTIGYSYTFTYKDKNTGAFGHYEIEIREGYITPKSSPTTAFRKPMTEEEYDMMRKVVIHPKDHTISVLK